jgi:FMN-dependent dehydrogenase
MAAEEMPVLFDSGVRSGSDVAKALALGATAVGIAAPTPTPWPSAAPTASWPNCVPSSPN